MKPRDQPQQTESDAARKIGALTLDQDALLASWQGERIDLSGTEFRMLSKLVRMPGHAVSYETLMNATHAKPSHKQHHQHSYA